MPAGRACGRKKDEAVDQARVLLDRLIASGVIERRTPGGQVILRFNLDPAAEYLAAIRRLFSMKAASRKEWQTYLSSLERTEGYPREPEGYLMALATCYKAYRREFSLPDAVFPWEETAEPPSSNCASTPQKSPTAAPRRPPRAKS
jgi:hypothetical protein